MKFHEIKKNICILCFLALSGGFLFSGCSPRQIAEDLSELNVSSKDLFAEMTPPAETAVENVAENYYYTQLPETSRQTYRQIVAALSSYETRFSLTAASVDEAHQSYRAVLYDYPEYFWLDGDSSVWDLNHGEAYELEPAYNMEADAIGTAADRIEDAYREFYDSIPAESDTYGKVLAAYEWIILHTDYDAGSASSQNIQSVLLNHRSVCAGYAKTFQYFMKKLGIPCIYVPGTADNGVSREAHAWNLVFIDGRYYGVDCTWGDPTYLDTEEQAHMSILYDYFCVTSEELNRTHTPDPAYFFPDCTDSGYNYYARFSHYYDSYDEANMLQAVWDTLDNNESRTFFKFSNPEAFSQARTAVEGGTLLEEPAQEKMRREGLDEYRYYYDFNETMYIIKIYW